MVDELTLRDNVQAIADHVVRDERDAPGRSRSRARFRRAAADRPRPTRTDAQSVRTSHGGDRQDAVGQPKVVLMDEPGAGLNEAEAQTVAYRSCSVYRARSAPSLC